MADIRLCTWCGAPIPVGKGFCVCVASTRARTDGGGEAPDPWELADHPERFDTEAARRRSRTNRST